MIDEETVGAEDITFAYCKFDPKMSFHKKHTHPEAEEVIYILSGRGICGVDQKEVEVEKGDPSGFPEERCIGPITPLMNPWK